jgi:stearoyl-CoA desaturase (delta-9 desaturase)
MSSPVVSKPAIIWLNTLVFSITFAIAAIGVPLYAYAYGFSGALIIAAIVATAYCGMSITAGYHRLWSHRSYQTSPLIEFIFALGGAFAVQNSILHWCSDHRVHHKHVDDYELDPYCARRGFWFSHIGWMLREYHINRYNDYGNALDLQKNKLVMWQHRHYLALVLLTNFGIPLLVGFALGDIWGSLLLVGVLRLVVSHHVTFFINSLAHMWGRQPYNDQNTAKDNALVALLTYGEGYHNYHHAFQFDYRNAVKWWQFDPTKWLIKSLSFVGLAKNLKTCPDVRINKSIAQQQLNRTRMKLLDRKMPDYEELLQRLQTEYDQLIQHMQDYYQVKKDWVALKTDNLAQNVEKSQLHQQYKELKRQFAEQQKYWQGLMLQYA